ncbi:MAG: hypothetical protein JWM91_3403 [Rhodospirillales bacterium]|nr:hypothetical protein [Rhodospirillales bacterium]
MCICLTIGLGLTTPRYAGAALTIIEQPVGQPEMPVPHMVMPALAPLPRIIQVGPSRKIKLPSQAAVIVKTGDIVEIDADSYVGDVAVWSADNLTIRGVEGRARLLAAGQSAENKAIWVVKGRNAIIENIEFAGAAVPTGNGAGIRAEGIDLRVVNCLFHDNQEGILSALHTTGSVVDIENSEFARDGGNGGQSHEIYMSNIRLLIVRGSYFHQGRIGHLIKSRAQRNLIIANRITDETNGSASYEIEFPNGGLNVVLDNLIEQSPSTQNSTILANAFEGAKNPIQELYVINNTFVNDLGRGDFIRVRTPTTAKVINNIFVGGGNVLVGPGQLRNNLFAAGSGGAPHVERPLFRAGAIDESGTRTAVDAGLLDPDHYDYRLKPTSPAIGGGSDPGFARTLSLAPVVEYLHPAGVKPVGITGPLDIGAYQHAGEPSFPAR